MTCVARPAFLALSCFGALVTAPALAEDRAAAADPQVTAARDRPDVVVVGSRPGDELESPKSTAPLIDTPQTITVVSDQVIRKQNLQTLRDVLQTVPGITFGAGEGGGGYGDSINLRGYAANTDITVDGVRDSAQYSRTDPFNLQQIEVYNGANSVFNGSGSVGGTINLVSKAPTRDTLTIVQGSVGTDDYYRASVDSNVRVGDLAAVRLNGAYHRNDVPGRDFERYERWGVAPSVTIGIDGPTSLTLAYVHQRDDNVPIYGVPYFKGPVNDGQLAEADDSDYFGYRNLDTQEQTLDRMTVTFRHAWNDRASVRNLTRWQRVGQLTVASQPQGVFCLATTGRQPVGADGTATIGLPCPANVAPGTFLPSGRGVYRNQENQLLTNQTDMRLVHGERGAVHNTLVVGLSASAEDYAIASGSLLRNADGSAVASQAPISIANPSGIYAGPVNLAITARAQASTSNVAVYAFDTLELGRMFELNGGVRWEYNAATFRAVPLTVVPPGTVPLTPAQAAPQLSRERLFSYRGGLVFKPADDVSLYASYGVAKVPSSATVRLGCGVEAAPGGADPCATAPETARNYEIGAKASLFGRLELTAALFRNERSAYRVPSNDPTLPAALQVLDGKSRVDGVALGLSGTITPAWTIFANYTYLDSKVRQSISDFDSGRGIADPQAGSELIQTPRHSGSLFTSYRLPFGLELGYGLTYQGSFALNAPTVLQPRQFRADDYLIHRAFLAYGLGNGLTAQLNVQNFTNERYFTTIRNNVSATTGGVTGGWAAPGDRRSAVFSLFYSF